MDNHVQVSFDNHSRSENLNKEKEITPESTKKDAKVVVDTQEKLFVPKAPFFQHLQVNRKKNHCERILEVFKNVQITIPFLDAINWIPSYTKFLNDLTTVKRKTFISHEATFVAQASCLIQQTITPKYKDPGSPTISVRIGNKIIDRCLLDLGASVNLYPILCTNY